MSEASSEDNFVDVSIDDVAFDVHFHPQQNVFAAAQISGAVDLYRVSEGGSQHMLKLRHHKDSVRSVQFLHDGQNLVSASSDRSVIRCDATGKVVWRRADAHDAAINVVRAFLDGMLVSGDDDGMVRIWDTRQAPTTKPLSLDYHKDVICDMCIDEGRATLLTASGDGTLGVVDLRKGKKAAQSAQDEDELLSVAIMKGGSNVVTGTQEGPILVWDWGKWTWKEDELNDGAERFTGHPASVSTLAPLDKHALVTGSEDGLVRLITVRPNKLIGVVGEYGGEGLPIERLAWNHDHTLLAVAGHEARIRLFDTRYLFEDENEGGSNAASSAAVGSRFLSMPALEGMGFGEDEEEDEEEEDMDDEDDEGESSGGDMDDDEDSPTEKRGGGGPSKPSAGPARGKGGKGGAGSSSFFDGL